MFMLAMLVMVCKESYDTRALRSQVHRECENATNRIEVATFRLVLKRVESGDNGGSHYEFSHINVALAAQPYSRQWEC